MAAAMLSSESYSASRPSISSSRSCIAISSSISQQSVKIGGLWKRSQGVSRFTKPNYKHRVFILTEQALSYYGGTVDKVGQLKGRVPLDSIKAVELVELSAFNLAHTFQIVYHSKKSGFLTLYIIATTQEECSDWVTALRQACYFNRDMLMHYHPGAIVKSKWTCCKQHSRVTLGCQPTYHLLTRSSSRYAQMRRRDTLTNSSSSQQPQAASPDRGAWQRSNLSQVEGLSSSCVELLEPHHHIPTTPTTPTKDSFTVSSPPNTNSSSKRSSKNSTDHSVGLSGLFISHVPVFGATARGSEEIDEDELDLQYESLSQPIKFSIRSVEQSKIYGGSRSQVGPSWTAEENPNRHSYEHRTLPRSFKTKGNSSTFTNPAIITDTTSSRERFEPVDQGGEPLGAAAPIPPPRQKRRGHNQSLSPHHHHYHHHHSAGRPVPTVTERTSSTLPSSLPGGLGGMRHSKTFVIQRRLEQPAVRTSPQHLYLSPQHQQHTSTTVTHQPKGMSHSMSTLTKPVIEPKVSNSNPNVIHV